MIRICSVVVASYVLACTPPKPLINAPETDLGHFDLVMDSSAFFAWKNHPFMNQFAVTTVDTNSIKGKPSYELYVLGQESFLHINLNKGYWQNKDGNGALVFQTRKPDQYQQVITSWKQLYSDSLYQDLVREKDFEVGEVTVHHQRDTTKPAYARMYPLFLSFSGSGYRNWGFTEEDVKNGITMNQFMESWDKTVAEKLFKKVTAVHVQLTAKELTEMATGLQLAGYSKTDNRFEHSQQPAIHYTVTETNSVPKIRMLVAELSRPVSPQSFAVGNAQWVVAGNKVEISFQP